MYTFFKMSKIQLLCTQTLDINKQVDLPQLQFLAHLAVTGNNKFPIINTNQISISTQNLKQIRDFLVPSYKRAYWREIAVIVDAKYNKQTHLLLQSGRKSGIQSTQMNLRRPI